MKNSPFTWFPYSPPSSPIYTQEELWPPSKDGDFEWPHVVSCCFGRDQCRLWINYQLSEIDWSYKWHWRNSESLANTSTLQCLWFEGDDLSAGHLLPLISCSAPSLWNLTLPLQFLDEWNESIVNKVVCPLQYIKVPLYWEVFPKVFWHAHTLLGLFPALETISERTSCTRRSATVDIDIHDLVMNDANCVDDRIIQAKIVDLTIFFIFIFKSSICYLEYEDRPR